MFTRVTTPNQINLVPDVSCCCIIYFNIILPPTPRFPKSVRYLSYRGTSFCISCRYQSTSCVISHRVTAVSTSQSPTALCCSASDRGYRSVMATHNEGSYLCDLTYFVTHRLSLQPVHVSPVTKRFYELYIRIMREYYVEIKYLLDATDDIYCRFYCMLNMFRAILCPSSGAREYYT